MACIQRAPLLAATIQVVEDVGYGHLTVSRVVEQACVSRKTFYAIFANCEECFLAVLQHAADRLRRVVVEAYTQQRNWRTGVRAALEAVLILLDDDPGLARICVVEALGGGPRILRFRLGVLRELAGAFDQARSARAAGRDVPMITGEAIAGSVLAVLFNKLSDGSEAPLIELLGPLMSLVTLPYLGARVASEELSKSRGAEPPKDDRHIGQGDRSPAGLGIRLTYRTVRVLTAIAQRPGASNREVAQHAGIADQGQASKLVWRLARLDLIENTRSSEPKGGPNAWRLSARGERLRQQSGFDQHTSDPA